MKKKNFFGIVMAAMAMGVGYSQFTKTDTNTSLSDTQMENIEALSDTEGPRYMYVHYVDYPWGQGCNCTGTGNLLCC